MFNKNIEQAAPKIFETEKLVSKIALSAGTFSLSTNEGGNDKIAGLNKLEHTPTKNAEIKRHTKNAVLFSGTKNKITNKIKRIIPRMYSDRITVFKTPNLLIRPEA